MIYPAFLKEKDTIGICAPSAGVGRKLEDFSKSIQVLNTHYQTKETEHVRINALRGGNPKQRGEEINALFNDETVQFVMCAAGGDFLIEMLPYISFETLKKHPKWLMGASDPTSILYPYTTLYDVATIYGANAGSFDISPLPQHLQNTLEIIKGNLIPQSNFSMYQKAFPWEVEGFQPDTPCKWESTHGDMHITARCIGGCIDGLKDLIGTPYDGTKQFLERYKEDGFIWYFDNFALSAENLYRTLLQMQYAGWFENTKAILIGRTLMESSDTGMTYADAFQSLSKDIPIIYNADIGHTMPSFTMINGAIADFTYEKGKASLKFILQ